MLSRLLVTRTFSFVPVRCIGGKHEDYIWKRVLAPDEWKGPKTKPEPWVQPGWWIEEHYPRRLPETEEQRRKSARKYGLREGDYKPLPLDACMGEYPDLGIISHELRDPYENWSDAKYKRNFNEPMSPEFMYYLPYRLSYTGTEKYTHNQNNLIVLSITIGSIVIFYCILMYGPSAYSPMLWLSASAGSKDERSTDLGPKEKFYLRPFPNPQYDLNEICSQLYYFYSCKVHCDSMKKFVAVTTVAALSIIIW